MIKTNMVRLSGVVQGALIVKPPKWKGSKGDEIRVEIPLDNGEAVIRIDTRVAHVEAACIGLDREHINLGNDELLHREPGQ
ncbi:MAG: hypothetical protein HY273_07260 [Gammaproteobacteria bacterium]|nr:hypothetical protein [Gammaproteobacteria bacterium]